MKMKISTLMKSYSTELLLLLITLGVIAVLYLVYGAFATAWVRVPASIVAPIIILVAYFYAIPDDPEMYRDSVFYAWVISMLIVFGMQFYLAYPSWGIVGYFILDVIIGYVGSFLSACAVYAAIDPYQ